MIGEEDQIVAVLAVYHVENLVAVLALLLVVAAQGLEGDLLEVSLPCQHKPRVIVLRFVQFLG